MRGTRKLPDATSHCPEFCCQPKHPFSSGWSNTFFRGGINPSLVMDIPQLGFWVQWAKIGSGGNIARQSCAHSEDRIDNGFEIVAARHARPVINKRLI